jgi:hypothetical protein
MRDAACHDIGWAGRRSHSPTDRGQRRKRHYRECEGDHPETYIEHASLTGRAVVIEEAEARRQHEQDRGTYNHAPRRPDA